VIISLSAMAGTEKSGLTANKLNMEEEKKFIPQAVVEVIELGPLKVTGNFQLKDLKRDKVDSPSEVWLCRCGKSGNKPYCDDSHKK
jgi:CDGSH iron-sulfur domain-containing protein 3